MVGDLVEPICNQILKAFLENSAGGHGWEWQLEEVRSLFSSLVMTMANRRRIRIIVDALDEAGVEAANELLTYFHRLIQNLPKFEADVRICIACRHYPVMEVDIPGYTIVVDTQNRLDIGKYVQQTINSNIPVKNSRDEITRNEIIRMISSGAGSSFQWACLIAPMAIRYHRNGESLDWIQERLAKVPPGLSAVYQHIFTAVIDEENMTPKRSLLLMQWISLAQRRLSLSELQFAMSSEDETDQLPLPQNDGARTTNYNLTKERVTSWSGGLAEVVYPNSFRDIQLFRHLRRLRDRFKSGGVYQLRKHLEDPFGDVQLSRRLRRELDESELDEEYQLREHLEDLVAKKTRSGYVQFIHQSVNDYLASEGLSLLLRLSNGRSGPNPEILPISAATFVPRHHEHLTKICLNYLQRKELQVDIFREVVASELKQVETMAYTMLYKGGSLSSRLFEPFEKLYKTFLKNANIRSTIIDVLFPFLSYVIEFWHVHVGNVENVASQYLPDFVKRLSSGIFENFIAIRHVQRDTTFDGQKLIHFASSRSDMKMIVQLLVDGGQVSVKDAMSREALHYAIRYGQEEVVGMLLLGRPDVEARMERLSASAWSDMEASMAPLSASAPLATTPLQLAALHGYMRIMILLLKHGVNRDSVSLKLAILRTDYEMVNLLLEHQWEVTSEHVYDALVSSSFEMFELLFEVCKCHFDINFRATNEPDSTMLHFAVRSGNTKAVIMLLDNGAKVLTPYISGETMQEYAEFRCHYFQDRDDSQDFMEIERLFLQHRADLRTAAEEIVSWTSWKKDDVLRFLRTKGPAHTPLDLFKSRTPLHWASERMFTWALRIDIEEFLQVLNACEGDMHVQDGDGMTPLHIAATHGHLDLVEELVKKGSKILAEMRDGRTPLDCARNHSQTNVIAYLESAILE
jgi:ankyrin repeat protein